MKAYANANFLSPQPYHKIIRTYQQGKEGKTTSKVTLYHENGQISDYLELVNGRACGFYRSWHPNGQQAIEAVVIEGMGDLNEKAEQTWVFDGLSKAWDCHGNLLAEIPYLKGLLQGLSLFYYPNGNLKKAVTYVEGVEEGISWTYQHDGKWIKQENYHKGKRDGETIFQGDEESPPYFEHYSQGNLISATYLGPNLEPSSQIADGKGWKSIFKNGQLIETREYRDGQQEGEVRLFSKGILVNLFHVKKGGKEGEEWVYYPSSHQKPQLYLEWHEGIIHGTCRSFYEENGRLESERSFCRNKKHGTSSAWYLDGSLMFVEEYENNLLQTGVYQKKGNPIPISHVTNGKGVATLYDKNGIFLKKVEYDQGKPLF